MFYTGFSYLTRAVGTPDDAFQREDVAIEIAARDQADNPLEPITMTVTVKE